LPCVYRKSVTGATRVVTFLRVEENSCGRRRGNPHSETSPMNIFKTFSLTWWQAAAFKVGLLGVGIILGAHWHEFFGGYLLPIGIVAAVSLIYVSYVWLRQ
jgi:hypothetical protein